MTEPTINILCMSCGEPSYVTHEQALAVKGCPQCGDTGVPADLDDMVTVTLTAHELRILTFWAEGYAKLAKRIGWDRDRRMDRVLKTIRDRLSMQTEIPLSISQEMADVREHFSKHHLDGKPLDMVIIDESGCCAECGEPVDVNRMFDHYCNRPVSS